MRVTVCFPSGEEITWGFDGGVPRKGDQIDLSDSAAPRSVVLVQTVSWQVTERGCGEVRVHVT